MKNKCVGCGSIFQFENPDLPGYITKEVYEQREVPLCMRCFRTRHYNDVKQIATFDFDYRKIFTKENVKKSLYVLVVDLFDLDHSLIFQEEQYLHNVSLLIIANKYDLLSHIISKDKLYSYLQKYFSKLNYSYIDILIYSIYHKEDSLTLQEILLRQDLPKQIYFIGATNVGKSSILNQLFKLNNKDFYEITTSNYMQTTLDEIRLSFYEKTIIDTPGVVRGNSFVNYLDKKTFDKITPKKPIKPRVYQLNPGQTLFIDDFVQLNFIKGNKTSFILYIENNLNIHRTKLEYAQAKYASLKKNVLKLPTILEQKLLGKKKKYLVKNNLDQKQDVVFAGLGFVTLHGEIEVEVICYENIDVYTREAMI